MTSHQSRPTREQILEALRDVQDPELHRSIVELNMVREIAVEDGRVTVEVLLTISGCPLRETIAKAVAERIRAIPGVSDAEVRLGVMDQEQRQALVRQLHGGELPAALDGATPPSRAQGLLAEGSTTRVIAIASGKGGVGKSTVTANLAVAMALDGRRVGVIDADIYGFSIPRMLGVTGRPTAIDQMLIPLESDGIRVMSIGFLLPDDSGAVVWRGPMLHRALVTFISDVHWGDDLEYLLIDLPPGTGDVSLTIAQTLPHSSMLIVTTPQPAAVSVARRAAKMAEMVNMEVIGVVENMSGFTPAPGAPTVDLFGRGGGQRLAEILGVPLLGEIPIDLALREGGDSGLPLVRTHPDSPASKVLREVARRVVARLPVATHAQEGRIP
jgi:ATP-binding protein involved in chromosome partitioning